MILNYLLKAQLIKRSIGTGQNLSSGTNSGWKTPAQTLVIAPGVATWLGRNALEKIYIWRGEQWVAATTIRREI